LFGLSGSLIRELRRRLQASLGRRIGRNFNCFVGAGLRLVLRTLDCVVISLQLAVRLLWRFLRVLLGAPLVRVVLRRVQQHLNLLLLRVRKRRLHLRELLLQGLRCLRLVLDCRARVLLRRQSRVQVGFRGTQRGQLLVFGVREAVALFYCRIENPLVRSLGHQVALLENLVVVVVSLLTLILTYLSFRTFHSPVRLRVRIVVVLRFSKRATVDRVLGLNGRGSPSFGGGRVAHSLRAILRRLAHFGQRCHRLSHFHHVALSHRRRQHIPHLVIQ
jgi:hypothetical protein